MNPVGRLPGLQQPLQTQAPIEAKDPLPIHTAVTRGDSARVLQLRREGTRANALDGERRSPLETLDALRGIDERSRSGLRLALLQSLNPTAPVGYMKPEALHGTPWGLEILHSNALKGGVNDAKGGAQSLEGKVFFSDRSPESDTDATTRSNLRSKARIYSAGKGVQTTNAFSRALQHRMTQVLMHRLNSNQSLHLLSMNVNLLIADHHRVAKESVEWLQRFLHVKYCLVLAAKNFTSDSLDVAASKLKLPETITLEIAGQP